MAKKKDESEAITKGHFVRCRFCGQKNAVKEDYKNMKEVLRNHPKLTENAFEAARRAGM